MKRTSLQYGYSKMYGQGIMDRASRAQKAAKAIAILKDAMQGLQEADLLEIGCSAGYGTVMYAKAFRTVAAIDIDKDAVHEAHQHNRLANVHYMLMDSQQLAFRNDSFEAVVCTHVYEHVPSAVRLMQEVHRVLRPGGSCLFSAGNRLSLIEPHYRLPLLSVVPKSVANWYLRLLGRGTSYYENHLSYWGLKKLVADFTVLDYTPLVAKDPQLFEATDVLTPGSLRHVFAKLIVVAAYWLCPTYLWVLKKPEQSLRR